MFRPKRKNEDIRSVARREINIEEPTVMDDSDSSNSIFDELNSDSSDFDSDFGSADFGGGAVPIDKHQDLLKQLTDFAPFFKEVVNDWLGLVWNEEKEKYDTHKDIEPIMNLKCAAWCVGFLKTYARRNNIITTIREKEYKFIMIDCIETIWYNIGTRYEEFDIKSDGDIIRICNQLEHAVSLVLMGAGGGKYNELLTSTTSRSETISATRDHDGNAGIVAPKKKSFFQGVVSALRGGR